jgi:hypothetical protein
MSGDGQPYWLSKSFGAKLPWHVFSVVCLRGYGRIDIYARVDTDFTSCDVDAG